MTTSPFGAPNQFGTAPSAPPAGASAAGPDPGSSRKPLLYVLGGVVAVAAVGAGAFFLLAPGDSDEPVAVPPVARGTGTAVEPEPVVPDEPVLVTQSSRNPFASLVLPGGAGAAATAPESSSGTTSGSPGTSSGGSSSGGSAPASAGADGQDGQDGRNGKDGKNGANGADGLTPMFITIQLVDVDESDNTVDAVVRTSSGETTSIDLTVGSPFGADSVAGKVLYKAVGTDLDADGQIDFVTVTVDGVDYTAHVADTLLGFVYE